MWAWHLYIIMPGTSFSLSRVSEVRAADKASPHGWGCFSLFEQQRECECGERRGRECEWVSCKFDSSSAFKIYSTQCSLNNAKVELNL